MLGSRLNPVYSYVQARQSGLTKIPKLNTKFCEMFIFSQPHIPACSQLFFAWIFVLLHHHAGLHLAVGHFQRISPQGVQAYLQHSILSRYLEHQAVVQDPRLRNSVLLKVKRIRDCREIGLDKWEPEHKA